MQTVVGRLVTDAKISETKDGRQVINFTLVENNRFKPKNSEEVKQVTTFYHCSYWMGTRIATVLTKGSLIEVSGRIGVNAWKNAEGEAKASLNLHTQFIKLHGKPKSNEASNATANVSQPSADTSKDDLPF